MNDLEPTILHDYSALHWVRPVEITEPARIYQAMVRERLGKGEYVFATGGDTQQLWRPTPMEKRDHREDLANSFSQRYGAGRTPNGSFMLLTEAARKAEAAMVMFMHRFLSRDERAW